MPLSQKCTIIKIMSLKRFLFLISATLCLVGCVGVSSRMVYAPIVEVYPTITQYRYAYIVPTEGLTTGLVAVSEGTGHGYSETVNPADIIAADLMERGYAILPALNEDLLEQTMIVNYGETYVVVHNGVVYDAAMLQLRDAKTAELIGMSKADGDGVRDAILRALDGIFTLSTPYFHPTTNEQ